MKNTINLLLLLVFSLINFSVLAQEDYKRRLRPIFTERPGYPKHGWIIGGGPTWGFTTSQGQDEVFKSNSDSIITGDYTGRSFLGAYIEGGKFHIFPSGIIFNHLDYTFAFKQMRYFEDFEGNFSVPNEQIAPIYLQDKPKWVDNNISVNFALSNVIQLTEKTFLQPGIGANLDLRVKGKRESQLEPHEVVYKLPTEQLRAYAHARLGMGIKLKTELFLVPTFIFQFRELIGDENNGLNKSYFHSEYLPLVFSVRVLFHKPIFFNNCTTAGDQVNLSNHRKRRKKAKLF